MSSQVILRNDFFPDEVVVHILARLPVKALFRCKSVSKRWYELTSDKFFFRLYNEVSAKNPMLLVESPDSFASKSSFICVDRLRGVSEISLDFIKDRVKVRASCNGLLCCSSVPNKGVYYVCNPMTRQYRLLPKSRERPCSRFHPDGEATLVGLACDLSMEKFNVVLAGYHRPFGQRPGKTFTCYIFDSESTKWRKFVSIQDDYYFTHMNRNQVVYVNGSLHWLTGSYSHILALDLKSDTWKSVSLPDEVCCGNGYRVYLLESNGSLSLFQISDAWMIIWVLKDYEKEQWEVVHSASLRCIKGMVPSIFPICHTDQCVFLATHKHVLVYQPNGRVWREMYSMKNGSTLPLWFSSYAFQTSIFPCQ